MSDSIKWVSKLCSAMDPNWLPEAKKLFTTTFNDYQKPRNGLQLLLIFGLTPPPPPMCNPFWIRTLCCFLLDPTQLIHPLPLRNRCWNTQLTQLKFPVINQMFIVWYLLVLINHNIKSQHAICCLTWIYLACSMV